MNGAGDTSSAQLPEGFTAGHWTDRAAWTGCTVVLPPPGSVASAEVRGGGPGTRETDLLSPAAHQPGVQAVLMTGGSAFGLAAADGVVEYLRERGLGYPTPAGPVPLVSGAVIFDLLLGDPAHPGATAGAAACAAADGELPRGSVGAGTGATVGKALGPAAATKGGLGYAALEVGQAQVGAIAVVNAMGEVLAEDGSVLAGAWRDGGYARTVELLRRGEVQQPRPGTATTLVCLVTDATLSKTDAWLVARAASAGVARAIDPSATAVDGDVCFCLASGRVSADPLALAAAGAHAAARAIRDAVRSATGAAGCPAAAER
jgi:L-aminopeptidase/D-esterase-like protein